MTHQATVAELVSRRPLVVWPDSAVSEIAEMLDQYDISGVPVVDGMGYLVGVVSQMDLLRIRASDTLWAQWPGLDAGGVLHERRGNRVIHRRPRADDDDDFGVGDVGDLVGHCPGADRLEHRGDR